METVPTPMMQSFNALGVRHCFLNAYSRTPESNPFAGKVICGICNQSFTRRGWKTRSIYRKVWQCQERYRVKGVQGCTNRHVDEAILEQAFMMAWNALIDNRDEIKGKMGDTC